MTGDINGFITQVQNKLEKLTEIVQSYITSAFGVADNIAQYVAQ